MRHAASIRVKCLVHMCDRSSWPSHSKIFFLKKKQSFFFRVPYNHSCGVPCPCMFSMCWHASSVCMRGRDRRAWLRFFSLWSEVWRASFICVTCIMHMCDKPWPSRLAAFNFLLAGFCRVLLVFVSGGGKMGGGHTNLYLYIDRCKFIYIFIYICMCVYI